MQNEKDDKREAQLRFVARYYREGSLDIDKAWTNLANRKGIGSQVLFRRKFVAVAASILLLLVSGLFYIKDRITAETASGQIKEVLLPDGTQVTMSENSTLRYDMKTYGKGGRAVKMSGKLYFQVEHDETRPFSVQTEYAQVTVLGTRFQVNEKSLNTEVNVMTGKVSFTAKNSDSAILTAGMSATYSPQKKKMILLSEEDLNVLAWKTKLLQFKNTPVDKVIEDLNAYYRVRISNGEDAQGKKLTATFHDLPLEEVLMVINQTLDIRLTSGKK